MDNNGVHHKSFNFIMLLFYQITVKVCVFMVDVLKTREAILPVFVMTVIEVWIAAIQLVSSNQITLNFLPTGKFCMLFFGRLSYLYPPQTLFVVGKLFSRCPSVRPSMHASVRPSVRNALFP